jgi:cyanophycinase
VRNGIEAEVTGSGLVTYIEGFYIAGSNIAEFGDGEKIMIQDMRVHLFSKGSKYHIPQMNPPHK